MGFNAASSPTNLPLPSSCSYLSGMRSRDYGIHLGSSVGLYANVANVLATLGCFHTYPWPELPQAVDVAKIWPVA